MLNLSVAKLQEFAPRAPLENLEAFTTNGALLEQFGITTPLRLTHFLAQTAHETAGYTLLREDTRWTPAQLCALWPKRFRTKLDPRILTCGDDPVKLANLVYSGRDDLGNVDPDDGWHYRGGGYIQITGRAMYHEASAAVGIDLEVEPEAIEGPRVALTVALWFWQSRNLNALADANYLRAIGNAINRGNPYSSLEPIGAKNRARWFERAWTIFGDGKLPDSSLLSIGASGAAVGQVQQQLAALGYLHGAQDEVLGPATARAIAAFKHDQPNSSALVAHEPGSMVGPVTLAALGNAVPIEYSPERTSATAQTLADAGSTEVAAGIGGQQIGRAMFYAGGLGGANKLGVLDAISSSLHSLGMLKVALVPAIGALQWGLNNWLWTAIVLGGAWYWIKGRQIVAARLEAHRSGANLKR